MAASRQEVDLIVNALVKGFDALNADIAETGESFGKLALKEQLAADKSQLFDKEMRGLAEGVRKGEISLQDASKRADDLAKNLGVASNEVKTAKLSWTDLKSALDLAKQGFEIVAQAAEFAYTNIKEGAQLELARAQFDNLAGSIGTTSDALLNKMGQATNGMMSNAEMIASASQLISLGLANNEEETVRLSKAVSTLGLDMQQVILTFANNSTARLDALGLSIEDVTTKAAELEAQGFAGDAFDETVLIALEEKMNLLGDASQTTAGQLQQLEADWKNLTDSLKQGSAEAIGPLISDLVKMRDGSDIVADALEKGLITQMQAFTIQARLASGGNKDLTEELANYGVTLDENNKITDHATERAREMSEFYRQQAEDLAAQTAMMEEAQAQAESYDVAMLQLVDTYTQTNGVTTNMIELMAALGDKFQESAEKGNENEAAMLRQEQAMLRMETGAGIVSSGFALIRGAADSMTGAVDRSSLALEKLLGYMNSLDGRNVSASVTVNTVNVADVGSGGAGGVKDDGKYGGGTTSYSGSSTGGDPTMGGGGNYVIQNNTFNNAQNPNAVATQTAEKLGGLK